MAEEGLQSTANELISIGAPIPFDTDAFLTSLANLKEVANNNDEAHIRTAVSAIVKTYKPAESR